MNKAIQFINDFKKSPMLNTILTNEKIEPIMIWVAGSIWLGTDDQYSDYDLCVLVKEVPKDDPNLPWRTYGRPNSYFLWYKPQFKKVDLLYTSVTDIFSEAVSTPLANIGWAQIKYWPKEAIIYKNPKYLDFINTLFDNKEAIFKNSVYLFLKSALLLTQHNDLSDLIYIKTKGKPNKLLAHVCWVADLLQNKTLNITNILTIKRTLYEDLPQDVLNYIFDAINYLKLHLADLEKTSFSSIEIQKYFEKLNL
jgi:hypothetical protein